MKNCILLTRNSMKQNLYIVTFFKYEVQSNVIFFLQRLECWEPKLFKQWTSFGRLSLFYNLHQRHWWVMRFNLSSRHIIYIYITLLKKICTPIISIVLNDKHIYPKDKPSSTITQIWLLVERGSLYGQFSRTPHHPIFCHLGLDVLVRKAMPFGPWWMFFYFCWLRIFEVAPIRVEASWSGSQKCRSVTEDKSAAGISVQSGWVSCSIY